MNWRGYRAFIFAVHCRNAIKRREERPMIERAFSRMKCMGQRVGVIAALLACFAVPALAATCGNDGSGFDA